MLHMEVPFAPKPQQLLPWPPLCHFWECPHHRVKFQGNESTQPDATSAVTLPIEDIEKTIKSRSWFFPHLDSTCQGPSGMSFVYPIISCNVLRPRIIDFSQILPSLLCSHFLSTSQLMTPTKHLQPIVTNVCRGGVLEKYSIRKSKF